MKNPGIRETESQLIQKSRRWLHVFKVNQHVDLFMSGHRQFQSLRSLSVELLSCDPGSAAGSEQKRSEPLRGSKPSLLDSADL